jgi:hypothetical protein
MDVDEGVSIHFLVLMIFAPCIRKANDCLEDVRSR